MATKKLALLAAGALLAVPLGAVAQEYTVTVLGTFGATQVDGGGVNARGQVTGDTFTPGNNAYHAFLYSTGRFRDLGALGGANSFGYGINARGQVTGSADTAGSETYHAFLYSDGMMQDLGTLGGANSSGYGINARGQVAGHSDTTGNTAQHAFLYSHGAMQDLGTLGGTYSFGYAINARGQVTGYADTPAAQHAFLYTHGAMQDLGALGGADSTGYGINDSGQVTGAADIPGAAEPDLGHSPPYHAFLYSNGAMQDLGTLGGTLSAGYGINASGQVTGYAQITGNALHAFLYSRGRMTDLNAVIPREAAALYALTIGKAINDSGQILVDGYLIGTQENAAFLLTPTACRPASRD
jgi:probable HAF family extracellular repeat protein